jgi:ribosomal protein L14
MIFRGSKIGVLDNTGIKLLKILQIYHYAKACVGDVLLSIVRKKKKAKEFVKKKIYFTFLISRRTVIFRTKGFYYLRLLKNRGLVLGADNEKILGTRHRGFLTLESKKKAFSQLLRSCKVLV